MGHMKWIYEMVGNGTISVFRALHNNAVKYNLKAFIFESKSFDVERAKAILELAKEVEVEYDKHIDALAEQHFEMEAAIRRGK